MVTDVSFYITLSFLKTIMIVRITQIVVSYRKYVRKKLVTRVMIQKELQAQKYKKRGKSDSKAGNLTQTTPKQVQKPTLISAQSPGPSLKSLDLKPNKKNNNKILVFSNNNIDEGIEELEETFKKQTRLESHVTMLTIKRTMT